MTALNELMAAQRGLSQMTPADLAALEPLARIEHFEVGARLLRTGQDADTLYVIAAGRVALEVAASRSGSLVVETLSAGDVLGISWMLPPYRLTFDARCMTPCEVIAIDAVALRAACDADPALGYSIYKHLSGIVRERLQATRLQLIDLYAGAT